MDCFKVQLIIDFVSVCLGGSLPHSAQALLLAICSAIVPGNSGKIILGDRE